MGFRLSLSDVIEVPVTGYFSDKAKRVKHSFTLLVKRPDLAESKLREVTVIDYLRESLVGWAGQTLVLDEETGNPVDFSVEAFDFLLEKQVGAQELICNAYLEAASVSSTLVARAKN